MREPFERGRRREIPPYKPDKFVFVPPAELPRIIEQRWWKKALPWAIGGGVLVLIVIMFATGLRQQNPMYFLFYFSMIAAALGGQLGGGGQGDISPDEVDAERADYLRYLSESSVLIREQLEALRANREWSHPDPEILDAFVGSHRMWERGPTDPDYLMIRAGLDEVALDPKLSVKPVESQLDREPVARTALHNLLTSGQSIHHCPKAIDFPNFGRIAFYGDREQFRAAMRAWIGQLACWHTPVDVCLAVVSPELESRWDWVKWLPHTERADAVDAVGAVRCLAPSLAEVTGVLAPLLEKRSSLVKIEQGREIVEESRSSVKQRHLVIVVDDPGVDFAELRRISALDAVTLICYRDGAGPGRDYIPHERELVLELDRADSGGALVMRRWENFDWAMFCAEPDAMAAPAARHLAQRMSRWDFLAGGGGQDRQSTATQTLLELLGISNAAALDMDELWGKPRSPDDRLRVPLGLQPDGSPVWLDFKDEAEGGMGPHGLMVGMTGSGKSTTLCSLVLSLLLTHSPDELLVILGDFKGEAEMDQFVNFPQVLAVLSNMQEKVSLVERFADTMLGLLDRRETLLREAGREYQGAAFKSVAAYNEARATAKGRHFPPLPTLLIIADEFTLMINARPAIVGVFDTVCRKGRTLGVHVLFASQTLDIGKIKDIDKNIAYKICLKVASAPISRQIIGTEDAYSAIMAGEKYKGTGFFVRSPGATPQQFRGFLLPARYDPPKVITEEVINAKPRTRLFTAGRVEPDPGTVKRQITTAPSKIEGPPRSLVMTVGPQLRAHWGDKRDTVWSEPLDEPIALGAVLKAAHSNGHTDGAPWWPLGKVDRPRTLYHGLLTYNIDQGNALILGAEKSGRSTAAQTFVLAAAARYAPSEVGFYCLAYGGPASYVLRELPHVGAVGGKDHPELNERILHDLTAMVAGRRRMYTQVGIGSTGEFRRLRRAGDPRVHDAYPTDVFLVIDGWEGFIGDNLSEMTRKNPLKDEVDRLIKGGSGYGVHVLVTAADWIEVNSLKLTCRWELKLEPMAQSMVKPSSDDNWQRRPQDSIPVGQPGRGITASGERPGDTLRFAVGRLDDVDSVEGLDDKLREAVAQIAARHTDTMPAPMLLPSTLALDEITQDGLSGEHYAFGKRGDTLDPAVINFAAAPLLAVYGDKGGKTNLVRVLSRAVTDRRGDGDDPMVVVFDINRRLRDETNRMRKEVDIYETSPARMAMRILQLAHQLEKRRAPDDWESARTWSYEGPKIYLFVDDVNVIPKTVDITDEDMIRAGVLAPGQTAQQRSLTVFAPLLPYLGQADEVGLRVILTHGAVNAMMSAMATNTLTGQMAAQPALLNRILLRSSATKENVAGHKFEELPPGRGRWLPAGGGGGLLVQIAEADTLLPTR